MSFPEAQYKVRYNGNILPGYLQSEDMPIESRNGRIEVVSRDGGSMYNNGTKFRGITLHFNVYSRLDNNNNGLQHLGDCLEQYRDVARYVTRVVSASTLFFGETDHYLIAQYDQISSPLVAPTSKRVAYNVQFTAGPWFYGPSVSSLDSISGNDTVVLNLSDTRKTYPVFIIPTGITGITISHTPSGKFFTVSGSHTDAIMVDCGRLTVTSPDRTVNYISQVPTGPDFGIYHVGSGSCTFDISGVVGSGNLSTSIQTRLER